MATKSAGGGMPSADIRDQLRRDHEKVLAELEALRTQCDEPRCHARLRHVRREWMIHALAEESVVYRALEGVEAANVAGAGRRFVEHELIEDLFDKLSRTKAGASEWKARLDVARELILRHIEVEDDVLLPDLAQRYDAPALEEMARQFGSARAKLALLENAKAA